MSSKFQYRPPSVFTPFWRRFTDERARDLQDTIALYNEVRAQHATSPWCEENALTAVLALVVEDVSQYVDLPRSPVLAAIFDRCLRDILALETTIFTFPDIDWNAAILSLKEQVDLRHFLRAQQHFLGNQERAINLIIRDLGNVYGGMIRELPEIDDGDTTFTVPLISLVPDPRDVVIQASCVSSQPFANAALTEHLWHDNHFLGFQLSN